MSVTGLHYYNMMCVITGSYVQVTATDVVLLFERHVVFIIVHNSGCELFQVNMVIIDRITDRLAA